MLSDCIQPIWINRQLNLKTPLEKWPVGVDQNTENPAKNTALLRRAKLNLIKAHPLKDNIAGKMIWSGW
jgi:hypothetical protein